MTRLTQLFDIYQDEDASAYDFTQGGSTGETAA